jgi:hypothetical protein
MSLFELCVDITRRGGQAAVAAKRLADLALASDGVVVFDKSTGYCGVAYTDSDGFRAFRACESEAVSNSLRIQAAERNLPYRTMGG